MRVGVGGKGSSARGVRLRHLRGHPRQSAPVHLLGSRLLPHYLGLLVLGVVMQRLGVQWWRQHRQLLRLRLHQLWAPPRPVMLWQAMHRQALQRRRQRQRRRPLPGRWALQEVQAVVEEGQEQQEHERQQAAARRRDRRLQPLKGGHKGGTRRACQLVTWATGRAMAQEGQANPNLPPCGSPWSKTKRKVSGTGPAWCRCVGSGVDACIHYTHSNLPVQKDS